MLAHLQVASGQYRIVTNVLGHRCTEVVDDCASGHASIERKRPSLAFDAVADFLGAMGFIENIAGKPGAITNIEVSKSTSPVDQS